MPRGTDRTRPSSLDASGGHKHCDHVVLTGIDEILTYVEAVESGDLARMTGTERNRSGSLQSALKRLNSQSSMSDVPGTPRSNEPVFRCKLCCLIAPHLELPSPGTPRALVSDFQRKAIREKLSFYDRVVKVDLSFAELTELPPEMYRFKSLTELIVNDNRLTVDPVAANNRTQQLYGTKAKQLFSKSHGHGGSTSGVCSVLPLFDKFEYLTILDMDSNNLSCCPDLRMLKRLRKLFLSNNVLSGLPGDWSPLQQLSSLHIERNQLRAIPSSLLELPRLRELHIAHNEIREFPPVFSQKSKKLAVIRAAHNRISTLPDGFFRLPSLRVIDFTSNDVSHLPALDSFARGEEDSSDDESNTAPSGKVETKDVREKRSRSLGNNYTPKASRSHKRAASTDATAEPSTSSPTPISTKRVSGDLCDHLEEVYLAGNALVEVPSSLLSDCPRLLVLDISSNPIEGVATKILECTHAATLRSKLERVMQPAQRPPRPLNASTIQAESMAPKPRSSSGSSGSAPRRSSSGIESTNPTLLRLRSVSGTSLGSEDSAAMPVTQHVDSLEELEELDRLADVDVKLLEEVKEIRLENCSLEDLPSCILQCRNLEVLSLHANRLVALPPAFGRHLSRLRELDLSNNDLVAFPSTLRQLKSLQVLDISNNMIERCPSQLSDVCPLLEEYMYSGQRARPHYSPKRPSASQDRWNRVKLSLDVVRKLKLGYYKGTS